MPDPDRPLNIIGVCPICGAQTEPIPTHDNEWHETEAWIYLAIHQHRQDTHDQPATTAR